MAKIRKIVFPVAGFGTRMLPATKALPKEMLPVVDRPIIQYALEEAAASGIEEFIFVTGRGKTIIEDHFDRAFELFETLRGKGKERELAGLEDGVPMAGNVVYASRRPRVWATPSGALAISSGTSPSRSAFATT
jgi:UTP--glucose-1-phosphate uridylyltransferase